jgi:hypothetical protein
MKFGTPVIVKRGGGAPQGTPGCTRTVRGILVGARGKQRYVKLTEDDSLATLNWCTKKGDIGHWGSDAVEKEDSKHNENDENCVCSECIWERFREAERD